MDLRLRHGLGLVAVLLAACNAASPPMRGAPALRLEAGGDRFILRLRPPLAEVTRINPRAAPVFEEVARNAAIALQAASGCRVGWLRGDVAMLQAGLACQGRPPPPLPRVRRPGIFTCRVYDPPVRHAGRPGRSRLPRGFVCVG